MSEDDSMPDGFGLVDDAGLPAIVVERGRVRATSEAAQLLCLGPSGRRSAELAKMLGLGVESSASNSIARAVRGGCIVSDRMVITDGLGVSRLLEVTTLPRKSDPTTMVILLREHEESWADPFWDRQTVHERRRTVAVPGRPRSRGLAPRTPGGTLRAVND